MKKDDARTKGAPSPEAALKARLLDLRERLSRGLVERDLSVRLALLAALSAEHLLLVGPPGTAKSLVATRLHRAFRGAPYFQRLLTRFTVPEELLGPYSIPGLEQGRYERLTEGYLPTAGVAFLDEIFKANSAILNALLTLLNEREFDNGTERVRAPLVAVVGASNELPEGEELDALFDRFLLRVHVGPVSKEAFPALLGLRGQADPEVPEEARLDAGELEAIRAAADKVEVPADVVALLCDLREWCAAEGMPVSDRRWRKVVHLLQVAAFTDGRRRVSVWDGWLLQHCLWDRPEHRQKVYDWYAARVGAAAVMDPSRLTQVVVAWEARLKRDQDSRSQRVDEQGRLLYLDANGKETTAESGKIQATRGVEPLFLAPPGARNPYGDHYPPDRTNGKQGFTEQELDGMVLHPNGSPYGGLVYFRQWAQRAEYLADPKNFLQVQCQHNPLVGPTRQKAAYIQHSLEQVAAVRREVEAYRDKLVLQMQSLEREIRDHLWVTPDFAGPASASLAGTKREVDGLLARIAKVSKGLEKLPREVEAVVEVAPQETSATGRRSRSSRSPQWGSFTPPEID